MLLEHNFLMFWAFVFSGFSAGFLALYGAVKVARWILERDQE